MLETLGTLTKINNNLYQNARYTVEQFNGRWYIEEEGYWIADFRTLIECKYWIGEQWPVR